MKTQKMSLANIEGKLSRTEMKNITAGSEDLVLSLAEVDFMLAVAREIANVTQRVIIQPTMDVLPVITALPVAAFKNIEVFLN
jgi:hypothetical protein